MVKKLLFFAIITLFATACGAKVPSDAYTLKGDITGLPEGTTLQLLPLSHSDEAPIAEAVVKGGKFEITGTIKEPTAVVMVVKNNYGNKTMVLDPTTMTITGAVTSQPARDGKTLYKLDNLTITGSQSTDKYNSLMEGRRQVDRDFNALQAEYADIHEVMSKPGQTRETIDSLRNTPRFKEMSEKEHALFGRLDKNYTDVVMSNKDTFWGPLMMIALVTYLSPEQRPVYEALSDVAKNSTYGKKVYQELYPLGETGTRVPEFRGKTPDGKDVTLANICKQNKYVLIDFWASWCRPCRASIPGLKAIYEKHGGKGLEIVSVSIDKEEDAWLKAVKKEAMPWINIRDVDGKIAGEYHVSSVPTMFIVDSKGNLIGENLHGEELAKKIDELLAK